MGQMKSRVKENSHEDPQDILTFKKSGRKLSFKPQSVWMRMNLEIPKSHHHCNSDKDLIIKTTMKLFNCKNYYHLSFLSSGSFGFLICTHKH